MTTHSHMRRLGAVVTVLATSLAVAACGSSSKSSSSSATTSAGGGGSKLVSNAKNKSVTIKIGSKNFTEQKVLGEIYAQALQAVGYDVKTSLNLGDEKVALKALKSGQIDAYPEYTGTALLSFFGVKSDAIPKNPQAAYDKVKSNFAKQGIAAATATPFTSSNEVAVTKATAAKYHLTKISDLKSVAGKLKLYGSPECRQRTDCLLGLQQVYKLKFKSFTPVDISLRHQVLKGGQADVSIVFTTDPQIKRDNEILLKDDKGMFPPYNSTLLYKKSFATKAGPDFLKTIAAVSKGLTAPVMQELNARVDLDKQDPAAVGKQYLKEGGFTS